MALARATFGADAEEAANERQPAGQRREDEILDEGRALARTVVGGVGFSFFRRHHGGGVLQEIDATRVTFSAVRLLVAARRTLERKRRVTARAEAGAIRSVGRAFGAFHAFIVEKAQGEPRATESGCRDFVTGRRDSSG